MNYFSNRRVRLNQHIRDLTSQVILDYKQFIQPIFVSEDIFERQETMSNVFIETRDSILYGIESDVKNGVTKFLLFCIPKNKFNLSENAKHAADFASSVIEAIINHFGDKIFLICDLCLCSMSHDGHCGIVDDSGMYIENHNSVNILSQIALQYAQSGANCIAPSDMMDGRVMAIRSLLNESAFDYIPIMSYSTKFASNLYGPFRDTCNSVPTKMENCIKDRKSYQIDSRNLSDAIASSMRDELEGADILMVKPSIFYLDVISKIKDISHKPLAAYHVSGEYMANELLAQNNYVSRKDIHIETWISLKRSGADMMISYATRNAKLWID